jgi:tetratricopeptide (TPR) repeat protein
VNGAALGWILALAAAAEPPLQPGSAKGHVERAGILRSQGDVPGALGEYREAVKADPSLASAHREIGLILLERRDFAGAAAAFRSAVRLDPKDLDSRYNLALSLANGGRPREGLAEIQSILRDKPGWALGFFGLGHIYALDGQPVKAEQSFRTAVRLDPSLARARFELGKLLEQAGDRDGALREFEAAVQSAPNLTAARYRMARLLQQTGQPQRGSAELAAMREMSAQRAKGEQAAMAYKHALELLDGNEFQGAVRELENAVQLRPDFTELRGALAEAHRQWGISLEAGDLPEAIAQFGKAIELEPDAETQNHLGVLLAKSGHLNAAIDQFRSALALRPGYRNAETNLRQALKLREQAPSP